MQSQCYAISYTTAVWTGEVQAIMEMETQGSYKKQWVYSSSDLSV